VEIVPLVADILDETRLQGIFAEHRPEFVVHAAAHKHVGLMESNVGECVRNNVFGTKVIADLAHAHGTRKFVLISTDKAVNPTSVMGASKQIAERYVNAIAQESTTAFIVVRFGNVLGSNGSVVPIFKEQTRRGGPITITDERMTRFFMTIPEASQLVLQAATMGRGGEIFVPEMGEQLCISDLARDLIRLSGLPADSIEIRYVGMRPGEKLFEELYFSDEECLATTHPKVRAAYHRPYSVSEVMESIRGLRPVVSAANEEVRAQLQRIVREYRASAGTLPPVRPPGEVRECTPPALDPLPAPSFQPATYGHGQE
jgi:FlaA1/EpsC-like NDP-sugar epimerase